MNTNSTTIEKAVKFYISGLENQTKKYTQDFKKSLKKVATLEEFNSGWFFKDRIKKRDYEKNASNLEQLKKLSLEAYETEVKKRLNNEIANANAILNTNCAKITRINISVEWKKSRTWGSNPTAEIRVFFNDNTNKFFKSESITGCGYDKESTAIAQALNQSNEILKLMYLEVARPKYKKESQPLGYGSGRKLNPNFEGGVGVSCYYRIFEKLGFEMKSQASGKMYNFYDVVAVSKKKSTK